MTSLMLIRLMIKKLKTSKMMKMKSSKTMASLDQDITYMPREAQAITKSSSK